jgi:hypothetical protein
MAAIRMTNSDKEPDVDAGEDAGFKPPGPVARDRALSSREDSDFEKPGPVSRDHIHDHRIKRSEPDDPRKEGGA